MSFYIPKTIMNYVVVKITFHLQNLQFYQNLRTDTSESFSTIYNVMIHNLMFWHETRQIRQNPIVQNFKKTP